MMSSNLTKKSNCLLLGIMEELPRRHFKV